MSSKKESFPFVKWVGGKRKLLWRIREYYPFVHDKSIYKYAEPFIGGGAVLFDILNNFNLKEIYISDSNADLINTYKVIRDFPHKLIELLNMYQFEFLAIQNGFRGPYYDSKRNLYNQLQVSDNVETNLQKAALFIFLNKTCFNGLYRVNKKGRFNVAIGDYEQPFICDSENIINISEKIQKIEIVHADYQECQSFVDSHTFVYLDPPYAPISNISSTVFYSKDDFGIKEQIELANFFIDLDYAKAKVLLSNSLVLNNFFESLYENFHIKYVSAARSINSESSSRGKVNELLISNY